MGRTITLELPDTIYLPAKRMAEVAHRPLAEVLVSALQASLPSLEGLPPALMEELAALEKLDDHALWKVMLSQVPLEQQQKLARTLSKSKLKKLTLADKAEVTALQEAADRVMLRKARAAVLLRFRGRRLPTLAELRKLSPAQ